MTAIVDLQDFVRITLAHACKRPVADVSLQTSMLDLQMDSLTFIAVVSQVEAVYDVQFTEAELVDFFDVAQVGDLVALLQRTIPPHDA
jgi:acyl carrier protein